LLTKTFLVEWCVTYAFFLMIIDDTLPYQQA